VIPSIASRFFQRAIWPWQERHTGISSGLYPKTLRAMRFWVAWNELIEHNETIDFFFRIEDIDAVWPEIRRRLGISGYPEVPRVERDLGTAEHGVQHVQPLSFEQMDAIDLEAAKRVREMAARYGYSDEETP
jgi:hypothetical protein